MRAIGLVLLLTVGTVTPALAEKIRINQPAKVYKRAGEQSAVVMKLKTGDKVTKIGADGRWIHIRSNGFTGWIPRTKADVPDEDMPRNTRRRAFVDGRGTDRGSLGGSSPDDRVGGDAVDSDKDKDKDKDKDSDKEPASRKPPKGGSKDKDHAKGGGSKDKDADKDSDSDKDADKDADSDKDADKDADSDKDGDKKDEEPKRATAHVSAKTSIYDKKDKESDVAFTAKPDEILFPGKSSGKWTEVENNEGDTGFVLTSKLELDDGGGDEGPPASRMIQLRARGGATYVQQGLRTAGSTATTVPDNYNLSVAAATISLGGLYLRPYNKDILFGADLNIAAEKAVPGIQYTPAGGMTTTTSFSIYDIDVRGVVAYDLHKKSGAMIVGRLGFRYDSFQVTDVGDLTKNPATIPSEIQISPAIGGGVLLPRVSPQFGLGFMLDGMFAASMKQTKGLEDGKSPTAKGICADAIFNYHYAKGFDIQAVYDLKYMSASYGAVDPMSVRNHAGTSVTRSDIDHMITVGIAKSL